MIKVEWLAPFTSLVTPLTFTFDLDGLSIDPRKGFGEISTRDFN